MSPNESAISVIIVTFRSGAQVNRTLAALAAQLGEQDELVIVDNASGDDTVAKARAATSRARVLEQDRNLGFAGGCNLGAAESTAPLLLFLNPDAAPSTGCLEALRDVARQRPGWGGWQALVTLPGGEEINTSGGVTHFLGFGWAGGCNDPVASAPTAPEEVGFASGAALVVRRADWEHAGGFDQRYFMYCEDLDLSLRLRLSGRRIGVAPAARVEHDYEFAKGQGKWFLLERNRAWTVMSDYPTKLLVLLSPALLALELALLGVAWQGGWLRQKLRAQTVVLRELSQILERRRTIQGTRTVSDRDFAARLTADLHSPYLAGAARAGPLVALQRMYWKLVLALL